MDKSIETKKEKKAALRPFHELEVLHVAFDGPALSPHTTLNLC
jgi:hypothetical protein